MRYFSSYYSYRYYRYYRYSCISCYFYYLEEGRNSEKVLLMTTVECEQFFSSSYH